jgi:hypothetical protein
VQAESLLLDQETSALLLQGPVLRLRNQAVLAAAHATTDGDDLRLSHVAYTACEAPCDIEEQRQRQPLPWQVTARQADLNNATDTLRLTDIRLELFEVPVARWPYSLSLPAPTVERRSGLLGPVAGFRSGDEGAWAGLPLYLTLGPSADTTLTPIAYSSGLGRLDTEVRLATDALEAETQLSLDSAGRMAAVIDTNLSLSPTLDLSLSWKDETDPGTLRRLQEADQSLYTNALSLRSTRGHSFIDAGFYQDRRPTAAPEEAGAEGASDDLWSLDWQDDWIPRAQYDLRLPPLVAGNRLRLQGQGLLLDDRVLTGHEATYSANLITRAGLRLSPSLAVGWTGDDGTKTVAGWLGGQMRASLPLVRHSPWSSTTLTPSLALTGLSGLETSDSPYQDSSVLSRSNLFDLRAGNDPFNHAADFRGDAALDFSLYPRSTTVVGLRGSVGQRLSWREDALAPTTAELFVHAGDLSLDLRSHIDLSQVAQDEIDWNAAVPRLALDIDVPLTGWLSLSGAHHRLSTDQDQAESNRLQMDFDWGAGLGTRLAVTTDNRRHETSEMGLETALAWNFQGDWVAETALRQNVFDLDDQDLSFDLYHRCDCLGAQIGVLRERRSDGTDYRARFALNLPTLFSGAVSPRLPRLPRAGQ